MRLDEGVTLDYFNFRGALLQSERPPPSPDPKADGYSFRLDVVWAPTDGRLMPGLTIKR